MLSRSIVDNMRKTASWMKFFAILTFIAAGILLISAIIVLVSTSQPSYYGYYAYDTGNGVTGALLYLGISIMYLAIICIKAQIVTENTAPICMGDLL